MSALKPTATPFLPSGSKSWADDDDEDDDITKDFAALSPKKETTRSEKGGEDSKTSTTQEDQPVASLASRISGLTTSNEQPPSQSQPRPQQEGEAPAAPVTTKGSETRPKINVGGNNLFGRALAGANRPPTSTPASSSSTSKPTEESKEEKTQSESVKEEKKDQDKMTRDLIDDTDGWGNPAVGGKSKQSESGDGFGQSVKDDSNASSANAETGAPKDSMIDERESDGTGLISNEFQVEVKLADLQADPHSPLYSIKNFEELPIHPDLLKGIYAAKFKKPSKIQEKALPMLLINPPRNLIGQSQSGTGKTAAFTLNMLSRVDPSIPTPQALCLAPSRELARQIQEVVDNIGQFTQIKTHLAVPGSWSRNVKIESHILIGTPGTIVDMLSRGGRIFDPKQIRVFVLDEADEMLAMQSLGDQTKRIKRMLPPGVQNVLFSATFPDNVRQFAEDIAPEANQIFLKKEDITVDAIKQLYLECEGESAKYNALSALYDIMTIGQSIVFCKRRDTADQIAKRLTEEGHSVASLHGEKLSNERDEILDNFRDGKTKVLITTNVVARGIDIQQVNMVVNYDVPDMGPSGDFRPDIETYIHRIGRTGRFGRKGCSVIFAHDQKSMEEVRYIAESLGKKMSKINVARQTDLDQLEAALKAAMKASEPK